jgi:CheY-like chemotaxis protein
MVFLVDDDADDIEIVQDALQKNNYAGEIATASNGQALMDHLYRTNGRPEVIVLDLNMPLKNGFEVLSELRNDPSLKSIPVIILTASSSKEDEIRCFELGCNMFWTKPSTLAEYNALVALIINFLKSRHG